MSEQLSLIPEERPAFDLGDIPLHNLPDDDGLPGEGPDAAMLESVRRFGIIQPIAVISPLQYGQPYTVIAGRRRIKAARAAEITTIPALVFPYGWLVADVLTLVENEQRSDNPAAAIQAILQLQAQGASDPEIAQAVGMPLQTLRRYRKLDRLIPALHAKLLDGSLPGNHAFEAATLPPADQQTLVDLPRIRREDIRAAKLARRADALYRPGGGPAAA